MKPLSRKIPNYKNYSSIIDIRDIIKKIEEKHGARLEAFVWEKIRVDFLIKYSFIKIRIDIVKKSTIIELQENNNEKR